MAEEARLKIELVDSGDKGPSNLEEESKRFYRRYPHLDPKGQAAFQQPSGSYGPFAAPPMEPWAGANADPMGRGKKNKKSSPEEQERMSPADFFGGAKAGSSSSSEDPLGSLPDFEAEAKAVKDFKEHMDDLEKIMRKGNKEAKEPDGLFAKLKSLLTPEVVGTAAAAGVGSATGSSVLGAGAGIAAGAAVEATGPFGALIVGAVAAGEALSKLTDIAETYSGDIQQALAEREVTQVQTGQYVAETAGPELAQIMQKVTDILQEIQEILADFVNVFGPAFETIIEILKGILAPLKLLGRLLSQLPPEFWEVVFRAALAYFTWGLSEILILLGKLVDVNENDKGGFDALLNLLTPNPNTLQFNPVGPSTFNPQGAIPPGVF
jgi:hypothetical protein